MTTANTARSQVVYEGRKAERMFQRRQEIALAGAGAGVVAVIAGSIALLRRRAKTSSG